MKHYTSLEQSRKLLELGLNPETADMCWITEDGGNTYYVNPTAVPWKNYTAKEFYTPCWSVGGIVGTFAL